MFASDRADHQPISRKDMIPTPSQPMNSWNILFAVTRVIMEIKKISRYLKNRLTSGSVFIYQEANSKIDQVTNRAIGVKVREYWSNRKLRLMLKLEIVNRWMCIIVVSTPLLISDISGIILVMQAITTAVLTCVKFHLGSRGFGLRVVSVGKMRIIRVVRIVVWVSIECMDFYLDLHQGLWRLKPVDDFYPLKVRGLGV